MISGPLAQLVEQTAHNGSVVGSSPTRPTIYYERKFMYTIADQPSYFYALALQEEKVETLEMELENIMAAGVDRGQIEIMCLPSGIAGVYHMNVVFKGV